MENGTLWSGSSFAGRFLFLFAHNGVSHAPPGTYRGGSAFLSDCAHFGKNENITAVSTIPRAAAQIFGDDSFRSLSLPAIPWAHLAIYRAFLPTMFFKAFSSLRAWALWVLTVQYPPRRGNSCLCNVSWFALCNPSRTVERHPHQSHLLRWRSRHFGEAFFHPFPFPPPLTVCCLVVHFQIAPPKASVGLIGIGMLGASHCGGDSCLPAGKIGRSFSDLFLWGSFLAAKSARDTQSRPIARLHAEKWLSCCKGIEWN